MCKPFKYRIEFVLYLGIVGVFLTSPAYAAIPGKQKVPAPAVVHRQPEPASNTVLQDPFRAAAQPSRDIPPPPPPLSSLPPPPKPESKAGGTVAKPVLIGTWDGLQIFRTTSGDDFVQVPVQKKGFRP
jgi:hypothetical protein